uniref:Uncharacterized protein n=1 Tax=Tetranychus urticae TaxID=32264 RepID=T1JQQ4_TETUR
MFLDLIEGFGQFDNLASKLKRLKAINQPIN